MANIEGLTGAELWDKLQTINETTGYPEDARGNPLTDRVLLDANGNPIDGRGNPVPIVLYKKPKQSWTPNPVAGDNISSIGAVIFATYVQQGNIVFFKLRLNDVEPAGTGISIIYFTLPVPTEEPASPINGVVNKAGAGGYGIVDYRTSSNTTEGLALFDVSDTAVRAVNISGNYIV